MPRGRIPYAGPAISSRGYDETLLQMMQNQLTSDQEARREERRLRRGRWDEVAGLPGRLYETYLGLKDRQQAEEDRRRQIEREDVIDARSAREESLGILTAKRLEDKDFLESLKGLPESEQRRLIELRGGTVGRPVVEKLDPTPVYGAGLDVLTRPIPEGAVTGDAIQAALDVPAGTYGVEAPDADLSPEMALPRGQELRDLASIPVTRAQLTPGGDAVAPALYGAPPSKEQQDRDLVAAAERELALEMRKNQLVSPAEALQMRASLAELKTPVKGPDGNLYIGGELVRDPDTGEPVQAKAGFSHHFKENSLTGETTLYSIGDDGSVTERVIQPGTKGVIAAVTNLGASYFDRQPGAAEDINAKIVQALEAGVPVFRIVENLKGLQQAKITAYVEAETAAYKLEQWEARNPDQERYLDQAARTASVNRMVVPADKRQEFLHAAYELYPMPAALRDQDESTPPSSRPTNTPSITWSTPAERASKVMDDLKDLDPEDSYDLLTSDTEYRKFLSETLKEEQFDALVEAHKQRAYGPRDDTLLETPRAAPESQGTSERTPRRPPHWPPPPPLPSRSIMRPSRPSGRTQARAAHWPPPPPLPSRPTIPPSRPSGRTSTRPAHWPADKRGRLEALKGWLP